MSDRLAEVIYTLIRFPAVLLLACFSLPVYADPGPDQGSERRLQQLLHGEALFYYHQRDYFSAITRLELSDEQDELSPASRETAILLARLKLAYGLDIDAAFELHASLDENVPDSVRNRAWFELARAFFHKGYVEAADEALGHIRGELPDDLVGDHQLLQATVWIDLKRNAEAASLLEHWKGTPQRAGYAWYNRGIALMRIGDNTGAVDALKKAAATEAIGEESLALRDKANLSLAYAGARTGDLEQAQQRLEKVRLEGPYSNRALLAMGWIAHKQGRKEAALIPWMELRGRSPTDPAVLETLLIVPSVYRDLDELQLAAQDYETAVATYTDELRWLNSTLESVRRGDTSLLQQSALQASARQPDKASARVRTRYFGRLLASRDFQESLQGHNELESMLRDIDRGLRDVERLAGVVKTGQDKPVRPSLLPEPGLSAAEPANAAGEHSQALPGAAADNPVPGGAHWKSEWQEGQPQAERQPSATIPSLPEIELPEDAPLQALPESRFAGLPQPEFSTLPGEPEPTALLQGPEDIALPDSYAVWLPETGSFRLPGGAQDYAYPDKLASDKADAVAPGWRRRSSIIVPGRTEAGFNPGAEPVGNALRDLAVALNSATQRMARLGQALDATSADVVGLEGRIAALRERILRLRSRVSHAIALNENYTRALAINELDRRQSQLEDLLEQASLELARTYDQAAEN